MNFKPCSEAEIADRKLWPKGDYAFEITDASEKVSQQGGNPMIELKVKISRPDGASRVISDYLVEQRAEKLKHAAAACGLLDKYESGSLPGGRIPGQARQTQAGRREGQERIPGS